MFDRVLNTPPGLTTVIYERLLLTLVHIQYIDRINGTKGHLVSTCLMKSNSQKYTGELKHMLKNSKIKNYSQIRTPSL